MYLQWESCNLFTKIPGEGIFTHQFLKFITVSVWGKLRPFVLGFQAQGDLVHLYMFLFIFLGPEMCVSQTLRHAVTILAFGMLQDRYQTFIYLFILGKKKTYNILIVDFFMSYLLAGLCKYLAYKH